MLTNSRRTVLWVVALLLFVPIVFLQSAIDPLYKKNYAPDQKGLSSAGGSGALPAEFALGAFTGFREAIAGLLWVRTDEFFHNGDYEAIMPMIRLITWLDPHQTDVYETGAWHMDYNFTDSQERSDRRYIPLALSLIKEGIANNPDQPDLYSDVAFVHYFRKIQDYAQSAAWFEKGWNVVSNKDLSQQAGFADADKGVMTVGHGLAHAYEFSGNIPAALAQWNNCLALHTALEKAKGSQNLSQQQDMSIAKKQLYELQGRMKYRPIDTKIPVDFQFHPDLVRIAPKEFVLKGTMHGVGATEFNLETGKRAFGPVDGCRVEIRLEDEGYKVPSVGTYTLTSAVDPGVTIMQDAVSVNNDKIGGLLGRKLDMSQDPDIYSFKAPRYTVDVWFAPNNPNDCPIQVQDRIGWLGEGMTDKTYLVTVGPTTRMPADVTPIPGVRMLLKTYHLSREDIVGAGKKDFG